MKHIDGIFIHINKCGGTSVKKLLNGNKNILICTNNIPGSDRNISYIQNQEFYKDKFSFTIIRHPFSRLISTYKMIQRDSPELKITLDYIIKVTLNLNISYNIPKGNDIKSGGMDSYIKRHTLPITHSHYGIVDGKNNLKVNFICKLENIDKDWKYIQKKLNITSTLPKKNVTSNKKILLNDEQVKLLYEYYKKDFKIFQYNKNDY